MPSNLPSYNPTPTKAGLLPNDNNTFDVTVVSPGNGIIIVVHVLSWIAAIVLSFVSLVTYSDLDGANDQAKATMMLQAIMTIVCLLGAAAHASLVSKGGPIVGVFLLTAVLSTTILSGANMALSVGDSGAYIMALFACLVVTLSSCMIVAFYINNEIVKHAHVRLPVARE
tara:strand:- start:81 stop:590 length:510 start_codon:yes stop_codon:yes gene_type:complete